MRALFVACAAVAWASPASAYSSADIVRLAHTQSVRDYMQGLSEGLLAANMASLKYKGSRFYCMPGGVPFTGEVATAMIRQSISDHPGAADENPGIVLQHRLIQMYPCP